MSSDDLNPADFVEDKPAGSLIPYSRHDEDLAKHRFTLAWMLLALVAAVALIGLAAAFWIDTSRFTQMRETVQVIFGPLVTLLGTSFAWYYATQKKQ